ncbi:MAG: cytochrome c3 family protein [Thermoanaerobaculia bacterium]
MPQIFHRSTNTISRVTLFGAVFLVGALGWVFAELDRSSYNTGQGVVIKQPVPFSHDHHTAALGIDCRYCHSSVENAASAGIPATATCMNCHKQIWADSPMLEPVRQSFADREPIRWERIHDLPDFVYFDHSIHASKGIGCATCHGRVDEMPLIYQAESLQMEWCLKCHRQPELFVRPREELVNMSWTAPGGRPGQRQLGQELVAEYNIQSKLNCSVCHR